MNYRVFRTIHDPALEKAWEYLQAGLEMTAFQQLAWNQMIEEEFQSNRLKKLAGQIRYFVLYRDDEPTVIAPLHIQKRSIAIGRYGYKRGIYFIGMKGYSDYLNFIYREFDQPAWEELHEIIVQETGFGCIMLLLYMRLPMPGLTIQDLGVKFAEC